MPCIADEFQLQPQIFDSHAIRRGNLEWSVCRAKLKSSYLQISWMYSAIWVGLKWAEDHFGLVWYKLITFHGYAQNSKILVFSHFRSLWNEKFAAFWPQICSSMVISPSNSKFTAFRFRVKRRPTGMGQREDGRTDEVQRFTRSL